MPVGECGLFEPKMRCSGYQDGRNELPGELKQRRGFASGPGESQAIRLGKAQRFDQIDRHRGSAFKARSKGRPGEDRFQHAPSNCQCLIRDQGAVARVIPRINIPNFQPPLHSQAGVE